MSTQPGQRSKIARRQAFDTVARLGGVVQPGSGNQWHSRGDVRIEDYMLVENKFTDNQHIVLKEEVVLKIMDESFGSGKDHWAVDLWIRPLQWRVVAVCSHFVSRAVDGGYTLPSDIPHMHIQRKQVTLRPRSHTESPFIHITTNWGQDLEFYLVSMKYMEKMMVAVRDPELRQHLGQAKLLYRFYGEDLSRKPRERAIGVIGGSDLGSCKRKTWYRLTGNEPRSLFSADTQVIFRIGHAVHKFIQDDFTFLYGPRVFTPEVMTRRDEYCFQGALDGTFNLDGIGEYSPEEWVGDATLIGLEHMHMAIADGAKLLLEIKSCSTIPNTPNPKHLLQAIGYGMSAGMTDICFLYVHKSSGQIVDFVRKVDNPSVQRTVNTELAYIVGKANDGTPPPREQTRNCRDCEYRWVCQPE